MRTAPTSGGTFAEVNSKCSGSRYKYIIRLLSVNTVYITVITIQPLTHSHLQLSITHSPINWLLRETSLSFMPALQATTPVVAPCFMSECLTKIHSWQTESQYQSSLSTDIKIRTTWQAYVIQGHLQLHLSPVNISSGVLGGIRGYTPYNNLRVFLTAYTHLSDHK